MSYCHLFPRLLLHLIDLDSLEFLEVNISIDGTLDRLPGLDEPSNCKSCNTKSSFSTVIHSCAFHRCWGNGSDIFNYTLRHPTMSTNQKQHSHNINSENYGNPESFHLFS
ncbi:hypothetical protein AHAS_Ahas13G0498500 [Arachis hypogaea]